MTSKLIHPGFLLFFLLSLWVSGGLSADTVDDVAETRANMLEVVRLRESLAGEKRAWREQRELMESQLRLDKQALALLETQLTELKPRLESLATESSRLTADLEESREVVDFWKGKLETLKARIAGILPRFPPRLRNELSYKLSDAAGIDYASDDSQLKRAFDICLEIISSANEYHGDIHLMNEIHKLADDRRGEFTVVYLGLSGGYYFSPQLRKAGIITWNGTDWEWVEKPELLDSLIEFRDVLNGQITPRYLAMPFQLGKEAGP